jgi:hypothetical protein
MKNTKRKNPFRGLAVTQSNAQHCTYSAASNTKWSNIRAFEWIERYRQSRQHAFVPTTPLV